jgi:hypothetical protein
MNNDGVAELAEKFRDRGLSFRWYPDARCECLTFQAGGIETVRVIVPAEIATGQRAVELHAECFRLLAFASTARELADKLASLPAPLAAQWPFEGV